MANREWLLALVLVGSMFSVSTDSRAQSYNVLKECMLISPLLDDIHSCLDNYLDVMDGSISGITDFLGQSLSGDALAGLERSQSAFVEYRRQNCLWYLDFSSPRSEAEQIAKNCLANMSQQRLAELQALVAEEDTTGQTLSGFYVFGTDRNSFQPCGTDVRYWLEGDPSIINRIQQLYSSVESGESQVLYAVFAGTLEKQTQAPADHQGVLNVSTLIEMRVPTDTDCGLASEAVLSLTGSAQTLEPAADLNSGEESLADVQSQEEPEQQLIAYFGAWMVDCTETAGNRACRLEVEFDGKEQAQDDPVSLSIVRQKLQATMVEVMFSDREIDSPSRIRWDIDELQFGDIVGSEIRVDEEATRQLIPSGRFLRNELLPMMIKGTTLAVEVLESVDDLAGERYEATLLGFTSALEFSDEFVREG